VAVALPHRHAHPTLLSRDFSEVWLRHDVYPDIEGVMAARILPASMYYAVFGALIVLTFFTIGISFLHLGEWHTVAGLTIAMCKAMLVALFFMHLLYSNRLTWIVLGAALFWLVILLALTMSDYLTRHWLAY